MIKTKCNTIKTRMLISLINFFAALFDYIVFILAQSLKFLLTFAAALLLLPDELSGGIFKWLTIVRKKVGSKELSTNEQERNSPWYPGTNGCPIIGSDKLLVQRLTTDRQKVVQYPIGKGPSIYFGRMLFNTLY